MNASDWRPLRLKDDYPAETNDERMSIFGCSESPKPIVGRPTGIEKTGNLAMICDSTKTEGVTRSAIPIKGDTRHLHFT
jgi:hypothetical protein